MTYENESITLFQNHFEEFVSISHKIMAYKDEVEKKENEKLKEEVNKSVSQVIQISSEKSLPEQVNENLRTTIKSVSQSTWFNFNASSDEDISNVQEIVNEHSSHLKDSKDVFEDLNFEDIQKSKKAIISYILELVCEKLNAQSASIFLISKDGYLEREGIYGFDRDNQKFDDDTNWISGEKYSVQHDFFTSKATQCREGKRYGAIQYIDHSSKFRMDINIENIEENIWLKQHGKRLGKLKCGIAIPINGRNKTYGVIRVLNYISLRDENHLIAGSFPIEDPEFILCLSALSTATASRLSNFRRDIQNRLIVKISGLLIQSTSDSHRIYQQVLDLLVDNPETAFKAAILRSATQDDTLVVEAKSLINLKSIDRDDSDRQPNDKSFLSLVAGRKQRIILPDVQSLIKDDDTHPFKNEKWIRDNGFQSFACFPLIAKENEVQGTLSLYTGYNYEFHTDSIQFLQGVADQLAVFVFRVKLEKQEQDIQKNTLSISSSPKYSEIESRFNDLVEEWKSDSSAPFLTQKCVHPAYQKIIGMGKPILPLLFSKLSEKSPEDWFWALSAITGADPVEKEHRGFVNKIVNDWIKWWELQTYEH
jgi:GAF domain-containing protein